VNFGPITFDRPAYLLLLVLVPVVWFVGRKSLAALGPWRRYATLVLRTAVVLLLVLGAAEIQWVQTSRRLTVFYLLDQSLSIPAPRHAAMIEYVNAAVRRHRKGDDRAGVIVFGREALVESPPLEADPAITTQIESQLDPEYTNLADAVKLAQAAFPPDCAKRIVVVSDGNENVGDALAQAQLAVDSGIGIDVVPITYQASSEVAIDKLALPADVKRGLPFDLRIVLSHATAGDETAAPIRGRLILSRRTDDQPVILSDQPVELPPGRRVFTLREQIDQPDFYSYEARFVPDDPAQDRLPQNNRATAHTQVRGSGQVLLIEDQEHRGEHDLLVERLRSANLEVRVRGSDQPFASLAELQSFDTVLLANVPREQFTDAQISLLVRNTHDMGCGLVMLGGANSFGAGGWNNTEIEAAMPVNFEIESIKVAPSGALMLVIDSSGSMGGEKIELSKAAAKAALQVLGNRDQVGVISFDSEAHTIVPLQKIGARDWIAHRIGRIAAGGGTNMQPAMAEGYRLLQRCDAALKHMIVLTDGITAGSDYTRMAGQMLRLGITTTSVAVGADAAVPLLESIAQAGGGKYYSVRDPRAIPRIFMKEARRVARPLVYEDANGFQPRVSGFDFMLSGIADPLPPLTGFVMTTLKANPLVEVAITSPVPTARENATILASWTYGLGRAVALTTDDGTRWAKSWAAWSNYEKFFNQLVRWSMRPAGEQVNFTVASEASEGQVRVVVTALDQEHEFLNFLDLGGAVVGPKLDARSLQLRQTAPGRYVGTFDAPDTGSYFLVLNPGGGRTALRTAVNVPYSPEFRDRGTNTALLERLAALPTRSGPAGTVVRAPSAHDDLEQLLAVDTFRHNLVSATRTSDAWPQVLWLAGLVFFGDVMTRRVRPTFDWLPKLVARAQGLLLRRQTTASTAYIERLRSRKNEVAESLAAKRAEARFEPPPLATPGSSLSELVDSAPGPATPQPPPAATLSPNAPSEDDAYTSRLLKAKRKVWEQRKPGDRAE
jgi:uncharacterized membrane protein